MQFLNSAILTDDKLTFKTIKNMVNIEKTAGGGNKNDNQHLKIAHRMLFNALVWYEMKLVN